MGQTVTNLYISTVVLSRSNFVQIWPEIDPVYKSSFIWLGSVTTLRAVQIIESSSADSLVRFGFHLFKLFRINQLKSFEIADEETEIDSQGVDLLN